MTHFKKFFIVILIGCMGIASAEAKIRFGVKAGLNVSNLHLNELKETFNPDNGTGWTAGVMTEFQLPLIGLGVDLSLMYTRMNAEMYTKMNAEIDDFKTMDSNMTTQPGEVNIGKNFIEIPLNVKYKISLPVVGSFLAPYVFTGPTFAFKLDKNTLEYFKSKTCQVAWNVGLGLELVKHLQIGASYGFGMNNVANSTGFANAEKLKVKNNYWTITAAYLF